MISPPSSNTKPVPVTVPAAVVTPIWTTDGAVVSTRSAVLSTGAEVGNAVGKVIGVGVGGIVKGVGVGGMTIGVGVG
jgi:hypothetical protein